MRATATIIMLTASLSLAACGSVTTAATTAVNTASTQPTPSATTNFPDAYVETATVEPADSPTDTFEAPEDSATKADAAADFTFDCYTAETEPVLVTTLKEAWDQRAETCSVEMDPSHKATAIEKKAVKLYKQFVSDETTQGALETMLGICAESDASEENIATWNGKVLTGTLLLCPTAPQAKLMAARAGGDRFDDGDYSVGEDVKAGTYRTEKGVRDCFWERTTKGGDTLANDFVTFAPKGVTVRIRSSDGGFTSKECGTWTRVH